MSALDFRYIEHEQKKSLERQKLTEMVDEWIKGGGQPIRIPKLTYEVLAYRHFLKYAPKSKRRSAEWNEVKKWLVKHGGHKNAPSV